MNELTITKELAGLDKSKAKQIEAVFAPMVKMLKEFEAVFDKITALEMSRETCIKAKRLRIDISKVRIDADKVRKIHKEEYLRAGNAIQGVYNILKFAVADKEEKLKNIETHYERIEVERKQELQEEREKELSRYGLDGYALALGVMDDVVWSNYLTGVKTNHEAVIAAEGKAEEERVEAEKKRTQFDHRLKALLPYGDFFDSSKLTIDSTEADFDKIIIDAKTGRTAHLKEQAKIKADNERLKEEAAEAAKVKAEADRKAEAKRQAQEAKIREEQKARERLEREIADSEAEAAKIKAEADRKVKEETAKKAAAEKKAQLAPDKEKLNIIATDLLTKKETVVSDDAKDAIETAGNIILAIAERM